jgi:hypothetical protein
MMNWWKNLIGWSKNIPHDDAKRIEHRQNRSRNETELAVAQARLEAERKRIVDGALAEDAQLKKFSEFGKLLCDEVIKLDDEKLRLYDWKNSQTDRGPIVRETDTDYWTFCLHKAREYVPGAATPAQVRERIKQHAIAIYTAGMKAQHAEVDPLIPVPPNIPLKDWAECVRTASYELVNETQSTPSETALLERARSLYEGRKK